MLAVVPAGTAYVGVVDVDLLVQGQERSRFSTLAPSPTDGILSDAVGGYGLAYYDDGVVKEPDAPSWELTDLEWAAATHLPTPAGPTEFGLATVARFHDSVDIGTLVADYRERRYTVADRGNGWLELTRPRHLPVTLVPDAGLVMLNAFPSLVQSATGEVDSASESGDFAEMTQVAMGAESAVASLNTYEVSPFEPCFTTVDTLPEAAQLSHGERYVHGFVDGAEQPAARTALRFANEATAERDAEARRAYLEQGENAGVPDDPDTGGEPFSDIFVVEEVEVDGVVQTVDVTYRLPDVVGQFYGDGCLPFLVRGVGPPG